MSYGNNLAKTMARLLDSATPITEYENGWKRYDFIVGEPWTSVGWSVVARKTGIKWEIETVVQQENLEVESNAE